MQMYLPPEPGDDDANGDPEPVYWKKEDDDEEEKEKPVQDDDPESTLDDIEPDYEMEESFIDAGDPKSWMEME